MKSQENFDLAKSDYIKNGGCNCYKCGSQNIEGGNIQIEKGLATQSVWCNNCEHEWEDQYTLTNIKD